MGLLSKIITKSKKEEKRQIKQSVHVSDAKKTGMKELYEGDKAKKQEKREKKYGNAYKILVKPLITEKGSVMNAEYKYIFEVAKIANKIEIAKAIIEVYGIKPVSVNIIKMQGKKTRYGKIAGKRKDWKKAIVTLPEGESIKLYEGV